MRAGQLRHRITLQSPPAGAKDAFGQPTGAWVDVATMWAHVRPLSTKETLLAGANQSSVTHEIAVRYRTDVLPQHRVLFGARIFAIQGIRNVDERNRELRILCEEGLSRG